MRKIIEGTLILAGSNAAVRLLGYFYRVLMGRMLTPYEYGLLNLALPLQYMIMVFTSSGVAPGIAKFVAEYDAKEDEERLNFVISSSLFYFPLIGLILGVVLFILARPIGIFLFHDPNVILPLQISAIALPFGMGISVYTGIFQGFKKIEYMSVVLIFEQVLRVVFAFVLVYFGWKTIGAISGSSLGFIVAVPFAYLLFRHLKLRYTKQGFDQFKEIFYFTVPTSATALSAFALAYIDIICLGILLNPEEVGIYSAASPTSRIILAFAVGLYAILLPSVSEVKAKGSDDMVKKYTVDSLKFSLIVLVPVAFLSIAFSREIIVLLFGLSYAGAARAFELLVFGIVFLAIFMVCSAVFQGINKPSIPMKILMVAVIMDVVFNFLLIPLYGIEGAALATMISTIFAGIISFFLLWRYL
ncbi:MAG: flippase [Candidatus Hydrothermarchaeales archaeon]